ncbi:MAG: AraC family transcriptional regulator [Halioglobus sp.]|nr:AraC family transcriptional regulator [Halioglobus sp.]
MGTYWLNIQYSSKYTAKEGFSRMALPDRNMIISANGVELVPNWKSRGIASVHLLINLGEKYGVLAEDCIHGSGISLNAMNDPFFEVEATQEFAVIRNLLHHLPDVPGLGFQVGQNYRLSSYGILGYALLSSPSLGSALELALRYLDLTFAFNSYRIEKVTEGFRISLDDSDVPSDCRQFVIERDAAATLAISRQLVQQPMPLIRVGFCFEEPPYAIEISDYYLCPVTFGGAAHELLVGKEWVELPLPQADQRTAQICQEQCKDLLDRRRVQARTSERVRQILMQPGGTALHMEGVAAALGVASRTLHRHLSSEGITFRQLLEEVRQVLSEEMLLRGVTVEEVADRLGYSEPSSFTNAFKRWKGICPRLFRQQDSGKA